MAIYLFSRILPEATFHTALAAKADCACAEPSSSRPHSTICPLRILQYIIYFLIPGVRPLFRTRARARGPHARARFAASAVWEMACGRSVKPTTMSPPENFKLSFVLLYDCRSTHTTTDAECCKTTVCTRSLHLVKKCYKDTTS